MSEPRDLCVDFATPLRDWDGFGVNYVEMSHSLDGSYEDYGSFSLLSEAAQEEVLELVFGPNGLRPALLKMFLNPYLLEEPPAAELDLDAFRIEQYLPRIVQFAQEGLRRTADRGQSLRCYAGNYGPPAWATEKKEVRGRDLDPRMKEPLGRYLLGCVKRLREVEGIPVEALGLHNEGEAGDRWPTRPAHDFNMYWPPEQVAEFIALMGPIKRELGVGELKQAPGETTLWRGLNPYADAIAADPRARSNLGLITSHGFGRVYDSYGIERLRAIDPDLHAWTTSTSWMKEGGVDFARDFVDQVYKLKLNGLIPWAIIQRVPYWPGGDPNPNPPLKVEEVEGNWQLTVRQPYFYYKQLTRAGQPGTAVADVGGGDEDVKLLGFCDNGSGHGDSLVVVNHADSPNELAVLVIGSEGPFEAYRTTPEEQFRAVEEFPVEAGRLTYVAPPRSVTTFLARGQ